MLDARESVGRAAAAARADATAASLAAAREEGMAEGARRERARAQVEIDALAARVRALETGVFAKLASLNDDLLAQVRSALPPLALEVGQRLLGEFVPPAKVVKRVCEEVLEQLHPETEDLELVVGSRDAALLERVLPEWQTRYPGLKLAVDETLSPGDCMVRSRFGVVDGRRAAKLEALKSELTGA
ncbi:hypothetical protein AW736_16275 [Termitidicoccus mucosus]|uniref:Flagellar assembly protein FliH n=1 Tax=Termitidicoccus mucosus TaxID=1184151 RepID=A0A178IF52_9BACT|nr:hypothetical protein AW736_16275 [Opitutaceae bacterium TSB47]